MTMDARGFPHINTFGELTLEKKIAYLEAIGDEEGIKRLKDKSAGKPPYQITEHQHGFIAPFDPSTTAPQRIVPAARVVPDTSLERIVIRLDQLRVFDY